MNNNINKIKINITKNKKINKNLIFAIIVFAISLVSAVFTFAWFSDYDELDLSLKFGTIDVETDNGTDNVPSEIVVSRANGTLSDKAMPGDYIKTNLRIKNVGDSDFYYLVCFFCNDTLLKATFNNDYYFDNSLSLCNISTTVNKKVGSLQSGKNQVINVNLQIDPKLNEITNEEVTIKCSVYAIQKRNLTEEQAYIELQKLKIADYPDALRIDMYNENGSLASDQSSVTSQINVVYTDSTKEQFYLDAISLNEADLVNTSGEQLYFFSDVQYTEPVTQTASLNSRVLYASSTTTKYDTTEDSYVAKLSQTIHNYDVTYDINNKIIYDMPDYPIALHPVFLKSNEDTYVKGTTPYLIMSRTRTTTATAEFNGHTNMKFVVIPNTITKITTGTFVNCSQLKYIVFPTSNLTTLGYQCFTRFGATNITLPKCITCLNDNTSNAGAFAFSPSLKKITILGATTISSGTFSGCSYLETVIINDNVTAIEDGAFYNCISLNSINMPTNLNSIGIQSFYNCKSLDSINFKENLKTISEQAFAKCSNLKTINLPENLNSIDILAFYQSGLKGSIGIPANCTFNSTSNGPFLECYDITSFYLIGTSTLYEQRDGVIYKKLSSGKYRLAFFPNGYNGNNGTFTITDDVTEINHFELENAVNIKKFAISSTHTNLSVDENGVLFNKAKTQLRTFPRNSSLTHYEIPSTVTSINNLCARNLISITIPSNVTTLTGCALQGSGIQGYENSIKRINSDTDGIYDLSNTKITGIPYKCFEYNYGLKHLILPSTCTSLGNGAIEYSGCNQITTYATSMVTLATGNYATSGNLLENTGYVNNNGTITYTGVTKLNVLNSTLKSSYESNTQWKVYTSKGKLTVNVMA